MTDVQASLSFNSTSHKALLTRARIYLHNRSYELAVEDFRLALEYTKLPAEQLSIREELHNAERLMEMEKNKAKDYYATLGVSRLCTDKELRAAYKRLSLIHHPDKQAHVV